VDIIAGAAKAWTNVDDRKHWSSLRVGRTRRSESGKKLRGVWDSNWAESFQPVDIVEVESALAIRKVLAGTGVFFLILPVQ